MFNARNGVIQDDQISGLLGLITSLMNIKPVCVNLDSLKFDQFSLYNKEHHHISQQPPPSISMETKGTQTLQLQTLNSKSPEKAISELHNTISLQNSTIISLQKSLSEATNLKDSLVRCIKSPVNTIENTDNHTFRHAIHDFCQAVDSSEYHYMMSAWHRLISSASQWHADNTQSKIDARKCQDDVIRLRTRLDRAVEVLKRTAMICREVICCDNTVAMYVKKQELKQLAASADSAVIECALVLKTS